MDATARRVRCQLRLPQPVSGKILSDTRRRVHTVSGCVAGRMRRRLLLRALRCMVR